MDDEDDPIVEEIPMYFNKNVQDNLYVFQFPTLSEARHLDSVEVANCCVKPINKEVKIDLAVDYEHKNYDRRKGEMFAVRADGQKQAKGERVSYKRGIIDKETLESVLAKKEANRCLVAILTDKELHMAPLASVLSFRPSLQYLDNADKRKKAEEKALKDDDDEEMTPVTVKFVRRGGRKQKASKVDEAWCETFWHKWDSPTAELERQKLLCTDLYPNNACNQTPKKYVEKLLYADINNYGGIEAIVPPRVINKLRIRDMPLIDQLKQILKDGRMLSYKRLKEWLQEGINPNVSEKRILSFLPQVGLLLQGNWLPQSEVLYPEGSVSFKHGIPAEHMIRARDYVIYKLHKDGFFYRSQILSKLYLPEEEAMEVLQSVAYCREDKKWVPLLPPDHDYEKRHMELVKRQEHVWRNTERIFQEMDMTKPRMARKNSLRTSKPIPGIKSSPKKQETPASVEGEVFSDNSIEPHSITDAPPPTAQFEREPTP